MSVCLVTLALSFSVYTTDSHYAVHVVYDILSVYVDFVYFILRLTCLCGQGVVL